MSFSTYLRHKLNEGVFTSKSIIAKLQLSSNLFGKLDSVTLSRWVNGHTIPTLEKQLMLIKCLESDLYPHLANVEATSVPRRIIKRFDEMFNGIETSYHSILNFQESVESNNELSLENVCWSKLTSLVPYFFESIASYHLLLSDVKIDNTRVDDSSVSFCSIRSSSGISSHLSFSRDIDYLTAIFGSGLNIDLSKKSLFFNVGYFSSRETYRKLVGTLLNEMCKCHDDVELVYVIARGADFLSFMEDLGGELIGAKRENRMVGNVYLLKFNYLDMISNPFLFSLIKEFY